LEDSCYLISEIYQINEVLFSEISQSFSARWKAVQSGGKLFIFIQVTDPTNYQERDVRISLTGTKNREFDAYRTSENENYHFAGTFRTNENGVFHYQSPPSSVTTFFGK
jgi:hypothetical protein